MSHLDFDIVSDFDIRISSLCYINSTNYYVRNYKRFMQNKPNFQKSQMNVNPYNTTDYENKWQLRVRKNKPNTNPIKPNLKRAKMNINSFITKDYRKKDDFVVRINKPNSNPISVKPKMSANVFVTKDYENKTAFRHKKTNPNKACPELVPKVRSRMGQFQMGHCQSHKSNILPGFRILFGSIALLIVRSISI